MKAQIRISGQINSVWHIYRALSGNPIEEKKFFNDKILIFNSVKECKDAIKHAGQVFRSEIPKDPMYSLRKNYKAIYYDAAKATIEKL